MESIKKLMAAGNNLGSCKVIPGCYLQSFFIIKLANYLNGVMNERIENRGIKNMVKNEYKKIEDKLTRYYKDKSYIERLKSNVVMLESQIDKLDEQIMNVHNNIHLECYQSASGVGLGIQHTGNDSSYFEKELMNQVTKLQNEKINKIKSKIKTENRIMDAEFYIKSIDNILNELTEKDKMYIEARYKNNRNDISIAIEMNSSPSTMGRMRTKILKYLDEEL